MTSDPKTSNGGKRPQILKHGTDVRHVAQILYKETKRLAHLSPRR